MTTQIDAVVAPPVLPHVAALLNSIDFKRATLDEARRRFSAQLAPDFNLFKFLRDDEYGVSCAIADLLDPRGSHGQGAVFLQAFASQFFEDLHWIPQGQDWTTRTELSLPSQRRIDICMESKAGLIAIENKPWAGDQDHQLKDYADYLKTHAGNRAWLLIYLCDEAPSEKSIPESEREALETAGNFAQIDFRSLAAWLDQCAALAKALPVRVFIEELGKFVRQRIIGEPDMSEKNEIIDEVLSSSAKINAAFLVAGCFKDLKIRLLPKLREQLEQACARNGFTLKWDIAADYWTQYSGFSIQYSATDRKSLTFEFGGSDLQALGFGVCRINDSIAPDTSWEAISGVMNTRFGVGKQNVWWPWWSSITNPTLNFGPKFENWNTSPAPWIEINDGTLGERIVGLALQVKQAFVDANRLDLLK